MRNRLVTFTRMAGIFILFACLFWAACTSDSDESTGTGTDRPDCIPGEHYDHFRLPFNLEYRNRGNLTFSVTCDETDGTLILNKDYEFLEAKVPYVGTGKRYTLPESQTLLYTFSMAVGKAREGICPDQPITLSLSLSTKEGNETLSGGLTVYCGTETLGNRSTRVMRLSGRLEPLEEP